MQLLWPLAAVAPAGTLDRLDDVHELLKTPQVVDVGRREAYRERDTLAVCHKGWRFELGLP